MYLNNQLEKTYVSFITLNGKVIIKSLTFLLIKYRRDLKEI